MDIQYTENSLNTTLIDDHGRTINCNLSFSGYTWSVWLQGHGYIGSGFNGDDAIKTANAWIAKSFLPVQVLTVDQFVPDSQESINAYNQKLDNTARYLTGEDF
jgi:hypothetical protein